MNRVDIIGRLTRDAELKSSTSGVSYYRNGLAVDRKGKDAGTDFFNVLAFGKTAEFLEKYFRKGSKVGISGHLQSGKYKNKDGVEVTTVEIVVDEADFCDTKAESSAPANPAPKAQEQPKKGFLDAKDIDDLPFA